MNQSNSNEKSSSFFKNDRLKDEKLYVEIPDVSPPYKQEKIPSGYDPMDTIDLRGRSMRGLASGRIKWWVLISGWIIFGFPFLLILYSLIVSGDLTLLGALVITIIPLVIVLRGTLAKLDSTKKSSRPIKRQTASSLKSSNYSQFKVISFDAGDQVYMLLNLEEARTHPKLRNLNLINISPRKIERLLNGSDERYHILIWARCQNLLKPGDILTGHLSKSRGFIPELIVDTDSL